MGSWNEPRLQSEAKYAWNGKKLNMHELATPTLKYTCSITYIRMRFRRKHRLIVLMVETIIVIMFAVNFNLRVKPTLIKIV